MKRTHIYSDLDPVIEGSWQLVINAWGDVLDRWYRVGDEAPYAHGKSTAVGLLSAAIARSHHDNLVLPGFRGTTEKGAAHVDLRAMLDERSFLVQLRYFEVSCRTHKPIFRRVAREITLAMRHLKRFGEDGVYRAAAVVAVPYVRNEDPSRYIALRTRIMDEPFLDKSSEYPILRADYYPDRPIPEEGKQALGASLFIGFHSTTRTHIGA